MHLVDLTTSISPISVKVMEGNMSVKPVQMEKQFSDLCGFLSEVIVNLFTNLS